MIEIHPAGNLTAWDVTLDRIPDPRTTTSHTENSSLANKSYASYLAPWTDFEQDVRKTLNSQPWHKCTTPIAFRPAGKDIPDNHACFEQFICGDEKSTSARYVEHVLNVMSGVALGLEIDTRFCDWKVVRPEQDGTGMIPDYGIVDKEGKPRAVAEGKTPWAHPILDAYNYYHQHNVAPLRKYFGKFTILSAITGEATLTSRLGQISEYMQEFDLKYGFLTTHKYTVFLKQAQGKDGNWVLYFSNLIDRATQSTEVDMMHRTPEELHGKVSVRECMLHLLAITNNGDYVARNSTNPGKWVVPGSSKGPLDSPRRISERKRTKGTGRKVIETCQIRSVSGKITSVPQSQTGKTRGSDHIPQSKSTAVEVIERPLGPSNQTDGNQVEKNREEPNAEHGGKAMVGRKLSRLLKARRRRPLMDTHRHNDRLVCWLIDEHGVWRR